MIFNVEVLITPKDGVLDTQGNAVEKTLTHLGFEGVSEVRVGRIVSLQIEAKTKEIAEKKVTLMCQDLLANELIEKFEISLKEHC
ncbi:MAG: phosphoribosylformylglycinamidine synthase subunit PurS [Synergistaceae bacterium]